MNEKEKQLAAQSNEHLAQDIAIVGMSLRFPGANTKEAFWHNLVNKISSVVEVPEKRWDWKDCYDPAPKKDDQKSISKWGGFIDDIDAFDAGFFSISPIEAKTMDPQQRLSLELAWECFEDAGISPADYKNSKTGVYVGCSNTDYQELTTGNIEPHFLTGMSTGVFANRISHYFNFHGPSLTVDTACSSSLVAIHKAIKDFRMNEISAALVGGVNLLITKSRYISFSKLGVLSPTGACKTLDASADGYVRGEGVGMILLMPVEKAVAENATIYGIIKGSSVSHSGKTKTLTSPNPFSQSRAITEAQEAAGIASDEVSYVELHGTGTRLGDPIEIQGLKRAFRATRANGIESDNPCYLSTVKTNIGHLESAAGIAGVIKVLLCLANKTIAPLQNFKDLNPKISLDKSPFELATTPVEWVTKDDKKRIAGISSFGFAGVNSHIIIEEPTQQNAQPATSDNTDFAVILSAKSEKALNRRAASLLNYIQADQLDEKDIENLSYTLQVGRESMKHRLGFIASSLKEVSEQLALFVENAPGNWALGKQDKEDTTSSNGTDSAESTSLQETLLSDWLDGYEVDWNLLYNDAQPKRISLPSYPFAGKSYWINQAKPEFTPLSKSTLHPLLHETLPAFNELSFVSRFDGSEFFLKDHIVDGRPILPGVCTLEMVSEAILLSHIIDEDDSIIFEKVNWLRPIIVDKPLDVYLSLWQKDESIHFEIWSPGKEAYIVYAQGQARLTKEPKPVMNLASFKQRAQVTSVQAIASDEVYQRFANAGIHYGPSFQGIESIEREGKTAFAKVKVDSSYCEGFSFSPALLDASLHALVVFAKQDDLALPFAVDSVEFHHSMPEAVLVSAKQTSDDKDTVQKFDVDICDDEGNVCVRFKGFSTRAFGSTVNNQDSNVRLVALKPTWKIVELPTEALEQEHEIEHLTWIVEGENAEPVKLFNHIKLLLDKGFGAKPFALTLVTHQTQRVHSETTCSKGAGLIGLTQSLAQEYPRWQVRIVDMQKNADIPWQEIAVIKPGFYAYRHGEFFAFDVANHHYMSVKQSAYQENGVYLVLGGAGGLGQVWSEWMIRQYDAQVIWIGRREENEQIRNALERFGALGKTPIYFSADAGDESAMAEVLEQIKARFETINGVVHSILHLEDQSLANMSEAQFLRSYQAKQQTGDVLLKLFKDEPLDFLLFFSSMQSFSPAAGQSNYAAGCHYLDSLALSHQNELPIRVVNWGYWGSVGIVQDEFYQQKMKQAGIGSIEVEEGMETLELYLSSSIPQIGVVKMQQAQLDHALKHLSFSSEETIPALADTPSSMPFVQDKEASISTEAILPRLCHALINAGWQTRVERESALADLPAYFQVWWQETERYLTENGLMQDGEITEPSIPDAKHGNQESNLLDVCLEKLPEILFGQKQSTDVLFPNGSLHLVEAVYQQNALADYANQVLVEQLQRYLGAMTFPSVKVLEVGAGTGGTTRSVLPALSQWQIDHYAYTDLSRAFFNHAKANYQKDYPFVETKFFDVCKPLAPQDIDIAAYDVVIATNVLHATAKIRETIQNAKACLKPGGILLINEVVEKSLFIQLTFGLLEGWWLSQDKAIRTQGSPLLSLDTWKRVLKEAGFINIQSPTHWESPQQILLAQSDGQIQQALEHQKPNAQKKAPARQAIAKVDSTAGKGADVHSFVQQTLFEIASNTLSIPQDELDAEESYADYGVDSILAVQMLEDINEKFDLNLPATLLFDYPSIATLSEHIATEFNEHIQQFAPQVEAPVVEETLTAEESVQPEPVERFAAQQQSQTFVENKSDSDPGIAVVGMSGQFGAASNLDEFWSMLINKETSVTEQQRWDLASASEKEKAWGRYASLLNDIDAFDAGFFSITPQEAMYMDPQQRLFLQECYKALEDANMVTQVAGENVGVYLGCAQGDYASLAGDDAPAQIFWGNAGSVIPARVSYFLNLKGPAIAIDTACSSSLVALHMATQALTKHEISSALVGGVATLCTPKFSNHAGKAGMLSPNGACHTFDDRADGFVPGEGVGVLVLKRLVDAQASQDQIYGTIVGSAINQDGTTSGITAPSSLSQEQLHREVYDRFNIPADSISMLEAHGTGTKLGDPIEFQALTRAYRKDTNANEFCALGSVKTNIGHCLTAAGVAGVIKTLLAMKHQLIPASLHFEKGNAHINWQDSPFVVNSDAKDWLLDAGKTRRAAVSSFGFSGTNAHVVLEEYPLMPSPVIDSQNIPSIIVLSAKTQDALTEKAKQLHQWLEASTLPEQDALSIAYTLQTCREPMEQRMGFVASNLNEIKEQLYRFSQKSQGHWKLGETKQGKAILSALDESDFSRWIESKAFTKLVSLWVIGAKIDWQSLYENTPRKLRLPTYPFAKERYWLPDNTPPPKNKIKSLPVKAQVKQPTAQLLHYTPQWQAKQSEQIAFEGQHYILSIGDLGISNAKVLLSSSKDVVGQFEDYSAQLLQHLKSFEGTKAPVLLQVIVPQSNHLISGLSGMLKTAALEYSYLQTQLIIVSAQNSVQDVVTAEANHPQDQIVRYQNGQREVLTFVEHTAKPTNNPLPWREGGVYLITGGMGQIGQTFAKEILSQTRNSTVVLVGRKPVSEVINKQLASLNTGKNRLYYVSADIANRQSCDDLMNKIIDEHGKLTGIIHSAGVIKDQLITNKTADELNQVFCAKVAGVVALDEASQNIDLDFFISFSSIAGVFGNIGQADYAAANGFLDQFMTLRQSKVECKKRVGVSLSINWPLWQQGGMNVDGVTQSLLNAQGITPLPNELGIEAFYQSFAHPDYFGQSCFLYGEQEKLQQLWHRSRPEQRLNPSETPSVNEDQMMDYLKEVISGITKISTSDLDENVAFQDMGFDSIMSMSIMQKLEEELDLDQLPPALLFEVNTIEELRNYLVDNHSTAFNAKQQDTHNTQDVPDEPLSLSKAQEGLWLLHKQFPQMSAYNVPLVFEVVDLNPALMQKALDWLCQKHPVLRLTMNEVEGIPRQSLVAANIELQEVNLNVTSKSALIAKVKDAIRQPFNLSTDTHQENLLWRAAYWRVIQGEQPINLMVIVFHHLIIDGVSATLLLEQLWNIYNKLKQGEQLDQPKADLGFFSYLKWEKEMLGNGSGNQLQNFWKAELQGELSPTLLPNRKGVPQRVGDRILLPLTQSTYQQLTTYLEQNSVSAPVFFLSAFQLLLNRHTRQQDIILGVPVLHRPKSDMADALGLFVNQLPLRNHIVQGQDFLALTQSNQSKLLNLINHAGYPLSEIVRVSNVPRSLDYHPVFQIGYSYHNFVKQQWFENNQVLFNAIWDDFQQDPELDLSLDVTPLPNQYRLAFKFDASVYDKQQMAALGNEYLALIEEVLNPAHSTLVELFEAKAQALPHNIAASFEGESLSYEALNQKANAFAHHLIDLGVERETLIALCVKPSLDLPVAIVGILKAGAAYVPVDPNSPKERMQFILADANPSVLVVQSNSTFEHDAGKVVYLDEWSKQATPSDINPNKATPDNLAYIIYTSGSTGKPKGVLVEHRNVTQLMANTQPLFDFTERDTWCLFHSYAFDFSVWEIWGALLHGGKLVIPNDQTRKESAAFLAFIEQHQISILNQTPSAFFPLMDLLLSSPEKMRSLRKVIFGGEALELAKLKSWFAAGIQLPDLINMYGITETTVHVTEMTVTRDLVSNHEDKSIIGQPLPGYSIHLLDEQKQTVPQGNVGEIFVGGTGVTRGYYNRSDLTNERFIHLHGERLYRSGDLARLNADGDIEYVGRADDQVQIRGFRIELGEIQHALLALEHVTNATVFAVDKQQGKVLVAYLISHEKPSVSALRAQLQTRLPEYMVPSHFVYVEQFPLTENGKIDKKALARLPLASNSVSTIDASDLQQSLINIWKEVLEIDHVGLDAPFFEAGGTSLLANVLSAKIQSQLGVEFPLTAIFQYSTIREMANYLGNSGRSQASAIKAIESSEVTQQVDDMPEYYQSSLAVIGVSCHYPDSKNYQAFWQNLMNGKDLVKRLSEDQDDITWLDSWVDGQDAFDPAFFKFSEKQARTLSYSGRQLLLHAYKAVEDAGYNSDNLSKAGVYVSASGMDTPDLSPHQKIQNDQFVLTAEDYVASTLNQPGTLPTMISYHLGFTGPSLFVHSNCSSSLSSVALASNALRTKEIDYALVGASCFFPQRYTGIAYEKGLNFAKDARCKVFDENADGMVGGNGVSVLVLKRAQDAINDADHIYSLIRGVSLNNDGKERAGFFAPGTPGQMSVIQNALKDAKVNPESITYVEAHGTGTSLGDPIEFSSLQQVYQQYTGKKQFCGLGAVKSNLGHTDTLAGLTGLLKTSLSLYHKKLPASLHYCKPNPQIHLENSPFYIVDQSKDWDTDILPRRAAVSSFGIGGTNAHAVLEEYTPESYDSSLLDQPSIVVLSAAKQEVLSQQVNDLLEFIESGNVEEQQRASLAYTLQTGRKVMAHRAGFVVSSIAELKDKLSAFPAIKPHIDRSQETILARWIETGFSNWDFLYQGEKVQKMSLPTYPFSLKSYKLPETNRAVEVNEAPLTEGASLQLQTPHWIAKPATTQAPVDANHHVVFCEVPEIKLAGATTQSLFTSHFSLDQKIEDYGYQLVEILKDIAQSKEQTLFQLVLREQEQTNLYFSFHSLLKTAALECQTLDTQLILLDGPIKPELLIENRSMQDDQVIRYRKDTREVLEYQTISSPKSESLFKADGVYLLTGGLGGICSVLIDDVNRQPFNKTIIATGRKPIDHPKVQQQLAALQSDKTTLKYYQLDVSRKMDVIRFVRDILLEFNNINGVIHAAGVLKDKLFINKDRETFAEVLAPKVKGVIALDEATQDLPLDFFICFGGLSGVNGAFTQIDYSMANAFLDSYMHYRDTLVTQGERSGKSRSIDWPYWKDGGMRINPQFEKMMSQYGITPMPSNVGISAFHQSLQQVQTLVVYEQNKSIQPAQNKPELKGFATTEELEAHLSNSLLTIAASILGVDKDELDPDADLGDVGADSIGFVSFINQINKAYQLDLSPSILFKHSTINSLLGYLMEKHGDRLTTSENQIQPTVQQPLQSISVDDETEERIAIVGISGEFPEAKDVDEFWDNLAQGKDCISDRAWSENVPSEVEWLGSVAREDNFDPLFFNIAPSESERIQLQDSLLMMHVWKCIEDAGYNPAALAGSNTGVFIGCQSNYHDGMVTSPAYAPNRMSYFLDLHGPSEGIDTTCSSSLVAVHKACQAIKQGECEQAIVGGVNVIDSPKASLALHDIGALSPKGRCKTFSADADGFVRGEGVGMIFVKKLSKAKLDNDAIYGTILGSALNHGGKSQGFTVPNSNAQAMLLEQTWKNAGIDPATLSYIECHGTGTSLGDPVEVDALKDAFKNTTTSATHCALGSVKSNIGHLEIAAGIAGVIKVLMQFKHKTLVPSLHVNELNPYLALDNTPFTVQTEKEAWECAGKRRAAVSSFGISGVNSHVVLEAFESDISTKAPESTKPSVVLLSASSKASLAAKVSDLSAYLCRNQCNLVSLSYTLQTGRAHLKHRVAWVVSSLDELKDRLANFDEQQIKDVDKKSEFAIADEDFLGLVDSQKYDAIARFWLEGKKFNWHMLYSQLPQRVHLPSYPFVSKKQDQWLTLNNAWAPIELPPSQDVQDQVITTLNNRNVLIVSESTDEQTELLKCLNGVNVSTVLFDQLEQTRFDEEAIPDVVFYFGKKSSENIAEQIKPLYQFIQTIEKHDSHAIELFYASFIEQDGVSREDITALLRSYSMRNPQHQWSMVEFVGSNDNSNWSEKLMQEYFASANGAQPNHIQYHQQQRFGIQLRKEPMPAVNEQMPPFKQNGVYLIAGALGELGLKLSRCLLMQYHATLILLGRRPAAQCKNELKELNQLPGKIQYLPCDLANESDVKTAARFVESEDLALNGIFHLGTAFSEDEASWKDFEQAMKVKVQGSQLLDSVFSEAELDFFVLFSSMAVFGTLNHLSYSYGNGYQNYFSSYRNRLVEQNQRHGKTLALNWGYWHSDDPVKSIENNFAEKKGYSLIQMPDAFELMGNLLASDKDTLGAVFSHDKDKIYQTTSQLLRTKQVVRSNAVIHNLSTELLSVSDTVVTIVSNVIGIEPEALDLECDLYEYGFDSISLLKTFQQLKGQLSIDLQADAFKNMNTIQSLIDEIEHLYERSSDNSAQEATTPEFILDAGLPTPPATEGLLKAYEGDINSVLLTGATGFLGSHILNELLTTTNAKIYCLVRAKTIKKAQERIEQTAASYKLTIDMSRIIVILGDMEQAQLGMSKANWQLLCSEVQHIVHTASYVNHIQPYFAFKKSVAGTAQLLSLAYTNTIKMLHFVSSTTASNQVKNSHFSVNPVEDFIDSEKAALIASGYGQSKWVQEENIRLAAQAGVPYTIYRFSEISASSKTGLGNTNDIFHRILRMMLSVPVKPKQSHYLIDIIPVDNASSYIVSGMNDASKRNKVFNVANPTPLAIADFYRYADNNHLSFATGSKDSFIAACKEYAAQLPDEDDRVIMEGLLSSRAGYDEYLFETYFMPMDPYHKDNFLSLVSAYDIEFVEWSALFDTYFKQWKEDKYYKAVWQKVVE